jgi:hypothetical protein
MKSKRARLSLGLFALVMCLLGVTASAALALSPSVETLAATSIGEKGATLNGKVNPDGVETTMYFEYGTTTSYGSKTAEVNVGSGSTTLERAEAISGLSANTVYHYRIVASNSAGTGLGVDKTFTTVGAPAVSGLSSSEVGGLGEEAKFKATVDPNGQSTTYQFEYGLSEGSLTNVVPVPAGSAGSGYEPVAVEATATGLTPGTKYYVRISATNASGKVSSSTISFTSSWEPGISGVSASKISWNSAELNATVEPHLGATTYYFQYGTTTEYGSKTSTKEISWETESKAVAEVISGLKPETLYHYRIVATNSEGTHTGTDRIFTTLRAITLKSKGSLIESGQPLVLTSSNLTFAISGYTYSCSESELTGTVAENPGARESVSTAKFQKAGGAACPAETSASLTAKFTLPKGITVDYTLNEEGGGLIRTSTFTFGVLYQLETLKLGECEFSVQLSGTYPMKTTLTTTLTGEAKLVKVISGECPTGKFSGFFAVTTKGNAVEAF